MSDPSRSHTPTEASPWGLTDALPWCQPPHRDDDKYTRGVLGVRTGSSTYPGAAVLGAEAAYRTGIGSLRFVPPVDDEPARHGLPSPASLVLATRPETVVAEDSAATRRAVTAWVLGSGTDAAHRRFAEGAALEALLLGATPLVVDAGALPRLAGLLDHRTHTPTQHAPIIATPHRGEFVALWRAVGLGASPPGWPARPHGASHHPATTPRPAPPFDDTVEAAGTLATHLGVTVLLKGSTTIVATPGGERLRVGPATPWLATAGTGDVLAGILGALLARHAHEVTRDPECLGQLGATAALLHDAAARAVAGDPPPNHRGADHPGAHHPTAGGPITALEVALAIPGVLASWRDA